MNQARPKAQSPCGMKSGAASVVFYLAAYIATNLLAFGIVMAFSREVPGPER